MSLHNLAHHVQSAGRGDDKVLVHMTPGEVKGLQSIAMAHGGSLTINPETGLPEAGFLSSILPMIAGFALGPAGLGMTAMNAGLTSAALGTMITGDLKKGVMAGIGAYGGAGLGTGLMAQGATGTMNGLNAANAGQMGVQANANMLAGPASFADDAVFANSGLSPLKTGFGSGTGVGLTNTGAGMGFNTGYATSPQLNAMSASTASAVPTAMPTVNTAVAPNNYTDLSRLPPQTVNSSWGTAQGGKFYVNGPGGIPVDQAAAAPARVLDSTTTQQFARGMQPAPMPSDVASQPSAFSERMSQIGRGAERSFTSTEGLKGLYDAMPTGSVIASGLTLAEGLKPEYKTPKTNQGMIRPYEFDYGSTNVDSEPYSGSAERTYFNPVFTAKTPYKAPGPEYAAAGGLMGFAEGGTMPMTTHNPVEQMSNANAIGANTGYPMANTRSPAYALPMERPISENVISSTGDTTVDPYTGEARFAPGGPVDTRPFFNPNTSGMSNENYTRSELAGGRRAPITTPTAPKYEYSYDPKTMQFTQAGANGAVTGGITQPTMQPAMQPIRQPASPAQPFVPNINIPAYQTPEQQLGLGGFYDYMNQQLGGYGGYAGYAAGGGVSHLGDYSDGGRLLKGPGDGVSDSIPASIGNRQPARLADGEFVVPARIVSELGNGSTEAGARKLYAMMDRVQKARRKTVGKNQVARNTKADKLLPA